MQRTFQSSWVTDIHTDKRAKIRHEMESDHRGWFLPREGGEGRWSDSQHVEIMGQQANGIPANGSPADLELSAIMWTGLSPYPIRSPADYYHDDKVEIKQVGSDMNQFLASKYGHYVQADPFRSPLQTMMDYKREEQDPEKAISSQDLANRYSVHVSDMDSYIKQIQDTPIHIARDSAVTRDRMVRNHRGPTKGVAFAATGIPAENQSHPDPVNEFHDGAGGSENGSDPHTLPDDTDPNHNGGSDESGTDPNPDFDFDADPNESEPDPNDPPEDHEPPKKHNPDAVFPGVSEHSSKDYKLLVTYDLVYAADKATKRAGKEFPEFETALNRPGGVDDFKSLFAPIKLLRLEEYTKVPKGRIKAPTLNRDTILKIADKVAVYNQVNPSAQVDPYTVLESLTFVRQGIQTSKIRTTANGAFAYKNFTTANVDFTNVASLNKPRNYRTTTNYKARRDEFLQNVKEKNTFDKRDGFTDYRQKSWKEFVGDILFAAGSSTFEGSVKGF